MFQIRLLYCTCIALSISLLTALPTQMLWSQELYPLHEPASTLGKNTLGVRLFNETYKEVNQYRNMTGLRIMYGLTPKLTILATGIASNHHGSLFPPDYPFHNTPERGKTYPMRINGGHLYGKYRFLTLDKNKQHFRMAAYAEGTLVNTSHHESEPNLAMGDTKGVGLGLINTYLYHKFAASLTLGYIHPFAHVGISPDEVISLPSQKVRTHYGKTLTYALSMGYLLFPKKYTSYKQINLNVYVELHGKRFGDGQIDLFIDEPRAYTLDKARYPAALRKGWFVDVSPGIQAIINSNLRIDCSVTLPMLGKSWARFYPVVTIGAQYYFYL